MKAYSERTLSSGTSRRLRDVAVAALASLGALATFGAPATWAMKTPHVDGNGDIAVCQFAVHVNLTGHGLTASEIIAGATGERAVTFSSDRGDATCVGKINGQTVAGDGTAEMTGSYKAMPLCVRGVGTGSITMQIPHFFEFFRQTYETLQGDFGLDLSGTDWRQLGSVVDDAGADSAFGAVSHLTADAGSMCTERAGTLSGRIVIGGTASQRAEALQAAR